MRKRQADTMQIIPRADKIRNLIEDPSTEDQGTVSILTASCEETSKDHASHTTADKHSGPIRT